MAYWNRGNANTALHKIDDAIRDYEVLGRRAEAIADFRMAQSIVSADQVSKQQLRVLGF